jgi:hypothetical protein
MWSKTQIRQARKIELEPILLHRGFRLRPLQNGNLLVEDYPNLVVKQHYWTWPSKEIHGNAIDFLVLVEGKSFHQAMQILTAHIGAGGEHEEKEIPIPVVSTTQDDDRDGSKIRQERGNYSEMTR